MNYLPMLTYIESERRSEGSIFSSLSVALRKHAYSNILKILPPKK